MPLASTSRKRRLPDDAGELRNGVVGHDARAGIVMLVNTPPGAALFRVIEIKAADDPALAPNEDLGKLVFWFDPDPYGHSSGIKPIHGYPLPIGIDQISTAVIDKADAPAANVHRPEPHGFDLIRDISRAMTCERSDSVDRAAGKNTVQPRWKVAVSRLSRFLHGWLSPSERIWRAVGQSEHPAKVTGHDDRARRQQCRQHVEIANGQAGAPNG